MRNAIANKTHYPNGITLLDRKFEELFNHEKGPGALPTKPKKDRPVSEPVKAIIVPHAPYDLAGPAMAWAYKSLAEQAQKTKLFIIIAQAQHSTGAGATMQTFKTPYGEVRVDQAFLRELVNKGNISLNDEVHEKESLIEIQLPFLQYINKNHEEKIKIIPLIVNTQTNIEELSIDIKETLLEQEKTATIIYVTNLTSYGRNFHYVPFTEHIAKNLYELDKQIINSIINFDKKQFLNVLQETLAPISGFSVMELFFHLSNPKKILLEQYYLSGDINNNYLNTVGYASFVIK
jgi:AmmeMemoRadiSam system protein B